MKKRTRNWLVGCGAAGAALGALTVASYNITKKLVEIAMDRKEPEIVKKNKARLSGSDKLAGLVGRMDAAEEKLKNAETQTVEITSRDGLKLVGHWQKCESPKRVIVAMHGWRSSWAKDFGLIADFWHDNDCAVLYAEQRAQGDSEGDYMTFGLLERYDCLDWINWVNEETDGSLPIYLGGVSMGASTILMTAGLDLPENVKGIVADCGFTSSDAIWKHVVSNNLRIPYGAMQSLFADGISKKKISMGSKEYSTVDAMQVAKVPILFIHGTDDHFVPVEMTYENYKACVSEKRLLIVPGAEHGMSYVVDQPAYETAIKKFWRDYN